MTELETKLLAALKVADGHLTTEFYGLCYEPSPSDPLGVIRAAIAEAEAARPHIGVGQMWRNRNGDLTEIVRKLDAPDRFRRQYLDADDCAYRHDGSFNGDGGFPCGYDLVELVGKEDRQ